MPESCGGWTGTGWTATCPNRASVSRCPRLDRLKRNTAGAGGARSTLRRSMRSGRRSRSSMSRCNGPNFAVRRSRRCSASTGVPRLWTGPAAAYVVDGTPEAWAALVETGRARRFERVVQCYHKCVDKCPHRLHDGTMMQSMGKVLAAAVFVPSAVLVIVVLAGVASAEEDLNGPCAEGERLQDYGTGVYRCFLTVPPYGSYTGTYGDDERGGGVQQPPPTTTQPQGIVEQGQDLPDPGDVVIGGPVGDDPQPQQPQKQPQPQQQPQSQPQQPQQITELEEDLPDPEDVVVGGPVGAQGQPPGSQPQQQSQQGAQPQPQSDEKSCANNGCQRVIITQPGGVVTTPCMPSQSAGNYANLIGTRAGLGSSNGGSLSATFENCGGDGTAREVLDNDATRGIVCHRADGTYHTVMSLSVNCPDLEDTSTTRGSQPPYSDGSAPDCSPGSDLRTRHDALIADGEESALCPD